MSERITFGPTPKRATLRFRGEIIADTAAAVILRETGYEPVIYFPEADVRMDCARASERKTHCPYKGDARYWSFAIDGAVVDDALWGYPAPIQGGEQLRGHVAFYIDKFGEDLEVTVEE